MTPRRCDVLIAGAGPAGAIAALVLARAGRHVLLVDAPSRGFRIGEALPPAARPLLRHLGLTGVLAQSHLPCPGNVAAWGTAEAVPNDFLFNIHGHGYHLDRARFDAALVSAAVEAGAELMDQATVRVAEGEIRVRRGGAEETVGCRWLLDATGRASAPATALEATRIVQDPLIAVWTRWRTASSPDEDARTLVEAMEHGWWYSALVPSGERVVAFISDPEFAARKLLLSPETYEAFVRRPGHVAEILRTHGYAMHGKPRGADAGSSWLDRFSGKAWLAAGDAAIAFDPLSSQGIFNALYTGMEAGDAVDAALKGDGGATARYAARLAEIRDAYCRNRSMFYAAETRWPQSPFWRRRAGGSTEGEAARSIRP